MELIAPERSLNIINMRLFITTRKAVVVFRRFVRFYDSKRSNGFLKDFYNFKKLNCIGALSFLRLEE